MTIRGQYIYRGFERFWHWSQAALILFLALTGFEIHGSFAFFGFEQAVGYHTAAATMFFILIAFAIFWHLTTGEWRQYLPTREFLKAYLRFYIVGIFRNEPHPTRRTAGIKLNPLQKLVYLGLKVLVIPVMVISGLLYMFYRYPQRYGIDVINIHELKTIALFHTFGGFLLGAFVIAHVYLTTTGRSLTSNLKAMITGYEDHEEPAISPETALEPLVPEDVV
jgi:thiosulfate reductase cytochrome b subunit